MAWILDGVYDNVPAVHLEYLSLPARRPTLTLPGTQNQVRHQELQILHLGMLGSYFDERD